MKAIEAGSLLGGCFVRMDIAKTAWHYKTYRSLKDLLIEPPFDGFSNWSNAMKHHVHWVQHL